MRIYAERPARLLRQLVADALVLGWVYLVVTGALAVRDLILPLQAPALALADAGDSIRGVFDGASRTAGDVPLVGEDLSAAFSPGTSAGESIAAAGREQAAAIAGLATGVVVVLVLIGLLPVLLLWVPRRVRYARAATAAVAVRGRDDDLLALRAMSRLPVERLLKVSPDPAAAWRAGDPRVVRGLADLELADLGLHNRRGAIYAPSSRPSGFGGGVARRTPGS